MGNDMTDNPNRDLIGKHFVDANGRAFEVTDVDNEFISVVHYRSLDERKSEGCILACMVRPNLRYH
jgi:hypothetical protein